MRLSSVKAGGVLTEVPEMTASYFCPSISTTTGTGEGKKPPPARMEKRFARLRLPKAFKSWVAAASANPTMYSRATPRFEVQIPAAAVALGWLVLKKVEPPTVVALETTFS